MLMKEWMKCGRIFVVWDQVWGCMSVNHLAIGVYDNMLKSFFLIRVHESNFKIAGNAPI